MANTSPTYRKIKAIDDERVILNEKRSKWLPFYFLGPIAALIISYNIFGSASYPITFMSAILSFIIYQFQFASPFKKLKEDVKAALVDEFMSIYHPNIDFRYLGENGNAEGIILQSGLISADRFVEEDIIAGAKGNIDFYLSEVNLKKRKKTKKGHTYRSIFKGMLFKIKLKNRSFTRSQIYTEPNILKQWFGSVEKNEKYGFWYDSEDEDCFHDELASLFPFIRHLSQKGDIRIRVQGDEIIMLMESDMKFLDDPKPKISRSFHDEEYYAKMSQQLNSLLFIIDSFADELTPVEIEEKLKLRMIEYADNKVGS